MSIPPESPSSPGDQVLAALHQILSDYGRRVVENPTRLRALLNDALGPAAAEFRAAIDALVVAAQEGVSTALVPVEGDSDVAAQVLVDRLAIWGLDIETARWAVVSWSVVLDAVTSLPATSRPPAAPPATAPRLVAAPTDLPLGWRPTELPLGVADLLVTPTTVPEVSSATRRRRLPVAMLASSATVILLAVGGFALTQSGGRDVPPEDPRPSAVSSVLALPTEAPEPAEDTAIVPPESVTEPPAPPAPPTATSTSVDYIPEVCGEVWCAATIPPRTTGTWDRLVVVGATPSHADAYANEGAITWEPHHNGYITFGIQWYVVNSQTGQRSDTATVSVILRCNTAYECF